jgi:SAM-dependent methyltransferase
VRLGRQKSDWEELAEVDLYWSILSDPEKRSGGWVLDEFFSSGEKEIEAVLARGGELGAPVAHRRALDFGCGAGRLTRALARRFDEAFGIDISQRMVDEARRINADVPNCTFTVNDRSDLRLFETGEFDLVYTSIVLQHLPQRDLVLAYVDELARVTAPGGLLAFQLISEIPFRHRLQPRRRVYHALRRLGVDAKRLYAAGLQPIAMTAVPERTVTERLEARGTRVLASDSVDVSSVRSTTYFATPAASPRSVAVDSA